MDVSLHSPGIAAPSKRQIDEYPGELNITAGVKGSILNILEKFKQRLQNYLQPTVFGSQLYSLFLQLAIFQE
ncbi:hypothetical protein E2C01_047845 [Portunus trituberculatus]|uniref:Uncharacterized protein n=1 Tax=Portunus trituberculatus TaxID=210409 RepID=A0A5B7G4N9_PORTR|nr:hypothetical protein [Portunus trituberculatus]